MTEVIDIIRVLGERVDTGRGYRNPSLESKRQRAIFWMRTCSKRKWIYDQVMIFSKRGRA